MLEFHTPILDNPQASSLCSRNCIIVVNAELKPDDVDVITFKYLVNDPTNLVTRPEYVHNIDVLVTGFLIDKTISSLDSTLSVRTSVSV